MEERMTNPIGTYRTLEGTGPIGTGQPRGLNWASFVRAPDGWAAYDKRTGRTWRITEAEAERIVEDAK
jgi:hypothetical protein